MTQALATPAGLDETQSPLQQYGADQQWDGVAAQFCAAWELQTEPLIMMVDDEPTTTEVLQVFLEVAGYRKFLTTNDSREAIRMIEIKQPDVLLLDLVMPEVSGFEILAAMREADGLRHVPVIMLTSSIDAETKLRALELGATDFLGNPVDPSELALRLRNTLRAKAHQDRLAYYDILTGLPNRALFERKLDQALQAATEAHRFCAVLHFDLDRFQKVNESLGHGMGDMALKAVSQRLESAILVGDMTLDRIPALDPFVARLGGDEFGIVLPDLGSVSEVVRIAEHVRAAFAQPFVLARDEMFISTCVGIAVAPHDGSDGDTLLQKASAATSHSKQKGLKAHQFYSAGLNEHVSDRLRLENQLHMALEREQLEIAYQPKICLQSGRVTGAEALLRWKLPDRGYVSPAEFIPIAEESGLIVKIGANVFKQVCQQLREWEASGHADLGLSVNVSALQFRDAAFLDLIHDVLRETGVAAHHLTIELTESVLMENAGESVRTLERIRALGPKISIDDFGTGYSSLSYLKGFAVDELKIDGSFMRDLPEDQDNLAIVNAIIGLAQGLGLFIVAEGVENVAQLEFLREHECGEFQGFIASRAVPPAKYLEFVRVAAERGWAAAAEHIAG